MAANMNAPPNVWSQMNYVPPRGKCNFRQGVMSTKCNCLRFMLHPLKSASSFECDGCAHHASFHSMENQEEDALRKLWEAEARAKEIKEYQQRLDWEDEVTRSRKRAREDSNARLLANGDGMAPEEGSAAGASAGIGRVKAKATTRGKGMKNTARAPRAMGKVSEILEDEEYIDLD